MGGLPLLDRVAPGDHVCWAVDDDDVRMEAVAGFVRAGLRARNKVLCSGDDPDGLLAGLRRHGIGTRGATASGQLVALPTDQTYLAGGVFDPVATLGLWSGLIEAIRAEGFPGVRYVGDMTWASRDVPGASELPWYEGQANTFFLDGYVAAVCAYDVRRFDPLQLRRLAWAHPGGAGPASPFDPTASLRVSRTREPWGLRLTGEVDLSNRDALAATMGHLFDGPDDVTVDVSGLTFADTAAVRIIVNAAEKGPGRVRLIGCSPALMRLLDFHHADDVPGLVVEPS